MQIHKASNERGIALVLALFLMSALSVLGASLMFLAQTETYASMNYRMMSQARYAAEAGVNKAANFLLDPAQYQVPTVLPGTDPLGNYDTTKSPVQINGIPVILTSGTWTGRRRFAARPVIPSPKARLYPTTAQITVMSAIRIKLCIIVPSTFFRRTSPP